MTDKTPTPVSGIDGSAEPSDADLDALIADFGPTQGMRADSRDLSMNKLRALIRCSIARFGTRPAAEPSQSGSAGEALRNLIAATNYLAATRISGDVDKIEFAQQKVWQCLDEGNAALSQPVIAAPVEAPKPFIPATMFHDEGAYARCDHCGRYSLDPNTLSNRDERQPVCECGKQHWWSGSFKKPGPDAKWSGAAPTLAEPAQQEGLK